MPSIQDKATAITHPLEVSITGAPIPAPALVAAQSSKLQPEAKRHFPSHSPKSPSFRASSPKLYIKSILLTAVLLRLGVICYVIAEYPRGWLFTKGMELGILGRTLALGLPYNSPFGGSTGPTAFLAPGYPFVISLLFRIFGIYTRQSSVAILMLHTTFGVATVALIMHIARRTLGVRVANCAGLWWAISPPLVWMPIIFWDTCASTMLLTGMMALALRLARKPTLLLWCVAGLYYGLTILINPSLFLALFVILGWAAIQAHRARREAPSYAPALAMLIMLAVFLPWPIRNLRVMHAFIPFRSNLGYELWNGNQHGGTGRFIEELHPMLSTGEYNEYASMGEVAYMRDKTARGKASIRAHPIEFLRTSAWRVPAFWLGWAQGGTENSGLVTAHALLSSALGLAGLVLLLLRKRRTALLFLLPLLVFPLPYYITHPDFRFRLLLDPLITILAAYTLVCAWRMLRNRQPTEPATLRTPHAWQ